MFQRMEQPAARAAMDLPIVARVLRKYRGVGKVLEEVARGLIEKVDAVPPAVPSGSLTEAGVIVFRLADSGIETGAEKRDGINRILGEQIEFVLEIESAQFGAGFVMRRVHRSAIQSPSDQADRFFERPLVVSPAHHRRRLNARPGKILLIWLRMNGMRTGRRNRRWFLRLDNASVGEHSQQSDCC